MISKDHNKKHDPPMVLSLKYHIQKTCYILILELMYHLNKLSLHYLILFPKIHHYQWHEKGYLIRKPIEHNIDLLGEFFL